MTLVTSADEMFGPPPLEPEVEPTAPSSHTTPVQDAYSAVLVTENRAPSLPGSTPLVTSLYRLTDAPPSDPAFGFLTPAFWSLVEERASRRQHPNWNDAAAVKRFTDSLRYRNGTVLLSELADAMGISPEFTRPYLRALHETLRDHGVEIRERRLAGDGQLGTWAKYLGEFMWPKDKNALYQERAALKRAVVKARATHKSEGGLDAELALQKTQDALEDCELRVAEMVKTTEHLPVERHAFVIVLDSARYAPPPSTEATSA